jgi:hypothetical protein
MLTQVLRPDRVAHFLVRMVGAATDRLAVRGRRRVRATDRRRQDLLAEAGARTAGRCRLGVLLDVVEAEQAFFLDRLDDDVPLLTPLQPQTSALSAIAAALLWPWWPTSPTCDWPKSRWSRIS